MKKVSRVTVKGILALVAILSLIVLISVDNTETQQEFEAFIAYKVLALIGIAVAIKALTILNKPKAIKELQVLYSLREDWRNAKSEYLLSGNVSVKYTKGICYTLMLTDMHVGIRDNVLRLIYETIDGREYMDNPGVINTRDQESTLLSFKLRLELLQKLIYIVEEDN